MNNTAQNVKPTTFAWLIVLFSCAMLMVSNGMTITGLSVYDQKLLDTFGWGRGQLKLRDMITLALTGLFAPLAGVLIDRYGVRRCMLIGWSALFVGYLMYSRIDSTLFAGYLMNSRIDSALLQLYTIHALFAVTLVFCGLNAAVILVSHWFVERRGMAIGFVLVGTSLGGMLFPQYGVEVSELYGWRGAFALGMVFPTLMLAISILVVRDRPQAVASQDEAAKGAAQADEPLEGVDYWDAIKTLKFWAITLIAMLTFYTVLGTSAHLFLYLKDLGYSDKLGANAISAFFFCALVGKFVFGILADYFDFRRVFTGNLLVMFSGTLMLALMHPPLILPAVIAYGLGWGGAYTVLQLIVINSFGLRSAGKILGSITVLDAIGGGLGIWLTGVLYEVYGDYRVAFTAFATMVGIALCLTFLIKPTARAAAKVAAKTT